MTTLFHDRINAVKALHWRKGKGDVREIRIFANGRLELLAQCYGQKPHRRVGRIVRLSAPGKFEIRAYGTRFRFTEVGGAS